MKFLSCIFCCLILCSVGNAQDYSLLTKKFSALKSLTQIEESTARTLETETVWEQLVKENLIPLAQEDSVMFLYKGSAQSVSWMGDFNGWGYDKNFKTAGTNFKNTDIWYFKTSFPKDSRFDYKILVNGTDWIIDPYNPNQQWSGVGGGSPNSELRMPGWKTDPSTIASSSIPAGRLLTDILFNSKNLGYQLTYSVYIPNSYTTSKKYPVIYVTDGYEYLHERMGNMQTTLNNLIEQKKN
jgi:hypothetical protein